MTYIRRIRFIFNLSEEKATRGTEVMGFGRFPYLDCFFAFGLSRI